MSDRVVLYNRASLERSLTSINRSSNSDFDVSTSSRLYSTVVTTSRMYKMMSNSDHLQQQTLISLTNGLQHGEYYLGPPLALVSPSPVRSIEEHLAKDVNTSEFVTMKILNFSSPSGTVCMCVTTVRCM